MNGSSLESFPSFLTIQHEIMPGGEAKMHNFLHLIGFAKYSLGIQGLLFN